MLNLLHKTEYLNQSMAYPKMSLPFRFLNGFMRCLPTRAKFQSDFVLLKKRLYPGVEEQGVLENGFVIRQAKRSDVRKIKNHPERFLGDSYMNRLVDGHGFFCVTKEDEVAAFLWYSLRSMCSSYGGRQQMILGKVPRNSVYLYDLYTFRKFRGEGLAAALLNYADAFFANSGTQHLVTCISPNNFFLTKLYQDQGYKPEDLFHIYRVKKLKKCFRGTKCELNAILQWIGL